MAPPRTQLDVKPFYALPLSIGTVTTLPAGSPATASIGVAGLAQVLNLGLPQGPLASDVSVRFDVAQALSGGQQAQALSNIGAQGILTAPALTSILGYAPARPPTTVQCSFGGTSDVGTDRTYLTTVDFSASAVNFLGIANSSFQNSTSGSAPTFAYLAADLLDMVSNTGIGVSGVVGVSCNYGLGYAAAIASFACSGLVLGRNYRFRLFASKSNGAVQIPVNTAYGTGINF